MSALRACRWSRADLQPLGCEDSLPAVNARVAWMQYTHSMIRARTTLPTWVSNLEGTPKPNNTAVPTTAELINQVAGLETWDPMAIGVEHESPTLVCAGFVRNSDLIVGQLVSHTGLLYLTNGITLKMLKCDFYIFETVRAMSLVRTICPGSCYQINLSWLLTKLWIW